MCLSKVMNNLKEKKRLKHNVEEVVEETTKRFRHYSEPSSTVKAGQAENAR